MHGLKMKLLVSLVVLGCSSHDPEPVMKYPPTVKTVISAVSNESALLNAEVTDDGGYPVIESGLFIDGQKVESGKVNLTELETYSIQAFARNAKGTGYGEKIDLVANCPSSLPVTVAYSTVSYCNSSGTIQLTEFSEGTYAISDASFGYYTCHYGDGPSTGVNLLHVCGEFRVSGTDQYGVSYTWSVSGNVIDWTNSAGDHGVTTLQW